MTNAMKYLSLVFLAAALIVFAVGVWVPLPEHGVAIVVFTIGVLLGLAFLPWDAWAQRKNND